MSTEKAMGRVRTRARAQKAVADAINAAVGERDREWREALMLWSGGSGLNTDDEFGEPLRALMKAKQ